MNDMEERRTFYDLHCHVLPGIDDGCKSPEESLQLLQEQYRQGCRGVVATPHYYASESIQSFLNRRKQAVAALSRVVAERRVQDIPVVCFGAEVAYRDSLAQESELERLCFGKSRYLLLEMPFTAWTDRTLRGVERITNSMGINPIIAHIERYSKVADASYIEELMNMDVLIQLNAGNFGSWLLERKALRLIRDGRIQVLSTDSHNLTSRPPNMELAIHSLEKHKMSEALEEILHTNRQIFLATEGGA